MHPWNNTKSGNLPARKKKHMQPLRASKQGKRGVEDCRHYTSWLGSRDIKRDACRPSVTHRKNPGHVGGHRFWKRSKEGKPRARIGKRMEEGKTGERERWLSHYTRPGYVEGQKWEEAKKGGRRGKAIRRGRDR